MKKRILSFLLILCMLVSILPTAAFAEETTEPEPEASESVETAPDEVPLEETWAEAEEAAPEELADAEYAEADYLWEALEEEITAEDEGVFLASNASGISNPRVVSDRSLTSGKKATWDCIRFGSYPQAEVVSSKSMMTAAIDETYLNDNDYIVDAALYSQLKSATGWNSKNEITINGSKYRRMKKSDAVSTRTKDVNNAYYDWSDSTTYHYFKYQPIKWRVLAVNGNEALVIADKCLDDLMWNSKESYGNAWSTSQIRSWLNGYSASANTSKTDYTANSFLGAAFSSTEQAAIINGTVRNNVNGNNTDGSGTSTQDRVFLLSRAEVSNTAYGFVNDDSVSDNARKAWASTYSHARGARWYTGAGSNFESWWWLRSTGYKSPFVYLVFSDGNLDGIEGPSSEAISVRPALKINLAASCWSYAGTVSSDGTVSGDDAEESQNPFADVSADQYYYEPVLWAVEKGITQGTSNTTFSPNDTCTRAQVVTFLWRAAGKPAPKSSYNPFTDVSSDQYYYKAVLWAVEKGITSGTSQTTFSPNAPCTRAQVVTFQWRAAGKPAPTAAVNPFTDVAAGGYYYDAVLWAGEIGITQGTSKTEFSPDNTCTRGQIVTFLYRQYS